MRFLDVTLNTIHENLALEEALLAEVEAGRDQPLLRLWELDHLAVVLGASGRLGEDVRLENCEADHVPISRRSSGGGTVVVGPGALNFSVVLHKELAPGLDAVDHAQVFVLERVAAKLRRVGYPVSVLGSGDLTIDRRKVAGSAQRRLKSHFMVHATILYNFPLDRIDFYTAAPKRQPAYRESRSHKDFVANLAISREALVATLKDAWGAFDPVSPKVPMDTVEGLVREKFGREDWVRRL